MSELWEMVMVREAWRAAVHGVERVVPGKGRGSRGGAGLTKGTVGALIAWRAGAGVAADAVLAGPVVEARLGGTWGAACREDAPHG